MKLTVNKQQRQAKMRAHTATHLLHFALDKMLGGTKQAGSLVDDDYLRFDFASKDALTPTQLAELEYSLNSWIATAADVVSTEMSMDEASQTGAKAFFEDKYGDTVRVVRIQGEVQNDLDINSIELCGGTHVTNTSHIGVCKIIDHSSVASGIRRIEAVTGTKVADYANTLSAQLQQLSTTLDCQPSQLENKLQKIMKDYEHIQADHAGLQGKIICTHLEEFHNQCELPSVGSARGNGCIINTTDTDLDHHNFKDVVNTAKSRRADRNWIIYNNEGNFAIYVGTGDMSAKQFAKEQGLKGGGSDQFAQGRDVKIGEIV